MNFRCCKCESVFSESEAIDGASKGYINGFVCPNCHKNIQKSTERTRIKGINLAIFSFILGALGNSVWDEWYFKLTGRLWWETAFIMFVMSIVAIIFLNRNNKEALISQTECIDQE